MSNAVDRIRQFHSTSSFGTPGGLKEAEKEAKELYRSLGTDDVQQLVAVAIDSQRVDKGELVRDVCPNLACLQPGSLQPFHGQLIDRQLYYPGVMFHGATADIAIRIVESLLSSGNSNRLATNHILCALAWIGDDVVQQAFDSWRRNPPE